MVNKKEVVQTIASLIKNGINMDGCTIFECNLFMKELSDFINAETALNSHYQGSTLTVESVFFDPLIFVELDKTTIQCIPVTDEGWLDAVFEVIKFIHIKEAEKREKESEIKKKKEEDDKELD